MAFYQDGTVLTAAELDAAFSVKEPSITAGTTGQYWRGDKTFQALNQAAVGLDQVNNTSDANKPVSTAQAAADANVLAQAQSYANSLVVGVFDLRGQYNASTGSYPTAGGTGASGSVLKGNLWVISVAGTLGGTALKVGDFIYAMTDNPAQTATNWGTTQLEQGYTSENIANKVTNLASPNNTNYPTTQAVQNAISAIPTVSVANGAATTGAVALLYSPSTNNYQILQLVAANSDVSITAPTTVGNPVTVGLNGTTLKYWQETSSAHPSSPTDTELLTWQPKTVSPFTLSKTVENIVVKQGLTFRDPAEAGATFPTQFFQGLDLQIKGTTGTAITYAGTVGANAYAFGEGNTVQQLGIALGIGNFANNIGVGGGFTAILGNKCRGVKGVIIGDTNFNNQDGVVLGSNITLQGVSSFDFNTAVGKSINSSSVNNSVYLGANITSTAQNTPLLIGQNISATSVGGSDVGQRSSIIVVNGGSGSNDSDQGINDFEQFGSTVRIPCNQTNLVVSDWTNTAWRTIPNTLLRRIGRGSAWAKYIAEFYFNIQDTTGSGTIVPTRNGLIRVIGWFNGTTYNQESVTKVFGSSDLLTYFNFQFAISGTGIQAQWAMISNPSGGSPNTGTVFVNGRITMS